MDDTLFQKSVDTYFSNREQMRKHVLTSKTIYNHYRDQNRTIMNFMVVVGYFGKFNKEINKRQTKKAS